MKPTPARRSRKRAFTLIEMTVALAMAMGIAGALVGLLQQQISFTKALSNFQFLREDAPQINTLLTNIVNKADHYRIYTSYDAAKSQNGAVRSGGTAVRLRLRNPDGTADHAIVCFEQQGSQKLLNYYFRDKADNAWPANPSWTISKRADAVTFDNSTGILLVTLAGPEGEEITYAGNPD